jgi:outer membrane lipoprotein-sorting protein
MAISKISVILLLLVVTSLFATGTDALYQRLEQYYNQVEQYQAKVSQENYWPQLDLTRQSSGMLYYDANRLILRYDDPDGQLLRIDSTGVLIYDPASMQVMRTDAMDIQLKPMALLQTYWQDADICILEETATTTTLQLKNPDNTTITCQMQDDHIVQLSFTDDKGNRVRYRFSGEVLNQPIPDAVFAFEITPQMNVIDNRQ